MLWCYSIGDMWMNEWIKMNEARSSVRPEIQKTPSKKKRTFPSTTLSTIILTDWQGINPSPHDNREVTNLLSQNKVPNSSSKCFLGSWHFLWGFNSLPVLNSKLEGHLQNSPPLDPIPKQLNSVHVPTPHIFPSYLILASNCWLPFTFPISNDVSSSYLKPATLVLQDKISPHPPSLLLDDKFQCYPPIYV